MPSGTIATLVVLFIVVLLAFLLGVREERHKKQRLRAYLHEQFGKAARTRRDEDYEASLPHYFEAQKSKWEEAGTPYLDDISWNDCEMDALRATIDRCVSAPGAEMLYRLLRQPLLTADALARREKVITFFSDNENTREDLQMILSEVSFPRRASFYDHLVHLRTAQKQKIGKYVLLLALSVLSIVLLFVRPLLGIAVLLPVMAVNLFVYFNEKEKIQIHVGSFSAVLRLMDGAKKISAMRDLSPLFAAEIEGMKRSLTTLGTVRRGASLVAGAGQVGTGLTDMLLEYLNMFFHLDQLYFNRMLDNVQGREEELLQLYETVGMLDALIACASYRASRTHWCPPTLTEDTKASIAAEALVHPLLEKPVPNDVTLEGGHLVTGSNASGKSTFLKAVALAAILAQTVLTVPAKNYRASFLRVYTSMALRDAMQEGESYFVVEIKSIKRMLDAADAGAPVLCVVDEVLRGTNTIERIAASAQILQTLQGDNVLVLAATHDLELTRILSKSYRNLHFAEEINGDDVLFSYCLKEGPATSRNAILLLGKAGYEERIVAKAKAAAARFEETGQWEVLSGE